MMNVQILKFYKHNFIELAESMKMLYAGNCENQLVVPSVNKFRGLAFTRLSYFFTFLFGLAYSIPFLFFPITLIYIYINWNTELYPFPFPMSYSFVPLTTLEGYILSMSWFVWGCISVGLGFFFLGFTLYTCVILFILWPFDASLEVIENMNEMLENLSFDDWTKTTMEMISVTRKNILLFKLATDKMCYLVEKVSFFVLVGVQVIAEIDPTKLAIPLAALIIPIVTLIYVITNEIILSRVRID